MMQPLLARTWLAQLERAYDRGEVEKGAYRNMRRTLVRAALGETGASLGETGASLGETGASLGETGARSEGKFESNDNGLRPTKRSAKHERHQSIHRA